MHSDYGTFFSPRVSALLRTGSDWSVRASAGTGFSAPTPLIEEVEARSLGLVNPLRDLRAERAQSASLDVKWAREAAGCGCQRVRVPGAAIRSISWRQSKPARLELINDSQDLVVARARSC